KEKDLSQSQDETELGSLMRRSQQGDGESYKTLLIRLNKMLSSYVQASFNRFGLARSTSQEDVVQEILLAIHAKRHTYDSSQYFLPWLYAIARYKIIDHLRKDGTYNKLSVPIEEELESLEAVSTHSLGADLDVMALVETLPPKQREILKLVKLDGLSVAE